MPSDNNKKGFTLIELLLIIGIIMILAALVLSQINPAIQFGKANDSERKTHLSTIISAVYQFQTSPSARGSLPECLLGLIPVATTIPECDTDSSGIGVGNGGFEGAVQLGNPANATTFDCNTQLVPDYLREMPIDPIGTYDASNTGYYICQDTSGTSEKVYVISEGTEIFTEDGGCEIPGTITPTMCVSG